MKLSPKQAKALLSKNLDNLVTLQKSIVESDKALLRCDVQFASNIRLALEAIAKNQKRFNPIVAKAGMSSFKSLPEDPQEALQFLVSHSHFENVINHYAKDELRKQLLDFIKPFCHSRVSLFKTKSNQIEIKFKDKNLIASFIHFQLESGGTSAFSKRDKFNPSLALYRDQGDLLLMAAYTAENGELAIPFPNIKMRSRFIKSLNLTENDYAVYSGQKALYLSDESLLEEDHHLDLHLSDVILKYHAAAMSMQQVSDKAVARPETVSRSPGFFDQDKSSEFSKPVKLEKDGEASLLNFS